MQVKDGENDHPKIGYSSPLLTLWQKPSTRFETPKAIIYLQFACPEVRPFLYSTYLRSRHHICGSGTMLPAFVCNCSCRSYQTERIHLVGVSGMYLRSQHACLGMCLQEQS